MAEIEEGDGYWDDDLDALDPEEILELENQAIKSTQHAGRATSNQQWFPDPPRPLQVDEVPLQSHALLGNADSYQDGGRDYSEFEDALDERHDRILKEPLARERAQPPVIPTHVDSQRWPANYANSVAQAPVQYEQHSQSSMSATLPHRGPASSNESRTRQFSNGPQAALAPAGGADSVALQELQAELAQVGTLSDHSNAPDLLTLST